MSDNSTPKDVVASADAVPLLAVVPGWVPHVVGKPLEGSADQLPLPSAPSHGAYRIDASTIRDAERRLNTILLEAQRQYEMLRIKVQSTESWVFKAKNDNINYSNGGHGDDNWVRQRDQASLNLSDGENKVLLQMADAIHLAGQYLWSLNQAAQLYSKADMDSFVAQA